MRILMALFAMVFTGAGFAAEQSQDLSQQQQPRQVELKWQAVKTATNEPNMKQRTMTKMQDRQRVPPQSKPLRRHQNQQGHWVIGHAAKAAKPELQP